MAITLRALCESYPHIGLAEPRHNAEILAFLEKVAMVTERGEVSASRAPDFFALGTAQGKRSFTVLFRSEDGSLGGIAALSVSSMLVKGREEALVYASDLRLSPALSRATRLEFHRWYAELALRCAEIEEFEGSPFLVTSVFDENAAAVRALVEKKRGKREPVYRPLFPYQNINVVARLPWKAFPVKAESVSPGSHEELKRFLVSNPEASELAWTHEEIERRLAALRLGYGDFFVVRRSGEIRAACLPFADTPFRRTVLRNLSPGVKWIGRALPLLGKPGFREGTPLRTGFLGFLKLSAAGAEERADLISALLAEFLRRENRKPRAERCHTVTVMDARGSGLEERLRKRGFLFTRLPATLYQVVHRKNYLRPKLLRASSRRPDFEVGLA